MKEESLTSVMDAYKKKGPFIKVDVFSGAPESKALLVHCVSIISLERDIKSKYYNLTVLVPLAFMQNLDKGLKFSADLPGAGNCGSAPFGTSVEQLEGADKKL